MKARPIAARCNGVWLDIAPERAGRPPAQWAGGKSGLHRTLWWVTPTSRKARESATESKPPAGDCSQLPAGKGETVR